MTHDIKYPEEISQDEVLKNLERLQAKLRRRKSEGKPVDKVTEDYVNALDSLINYKREDEE